MALNFPLSPTAGDTYSATGTLWEFDGTGWNIISNNPTQLQVLGGIDNVTNSPHITANLVLKSAGDGTTVGTGTYFFDSQIDTLQELSNVDTTTNSPLVSGDLVLVSTTNGQFGFKSIDDVTSTYLTPSNINATNGVQAYDANLQGFLGAFNLPTGVTKGILTSDVNGQITVTTNPLSALNWTLSVNGNNDLLFSYQGSVVARLTTNGQFSALNDVVAFENAPIT